LDTSARNSARNIELAPTNCSPIGGLGSPYAGAFLVNGPDLNGGWFVAPGLTSDIGGNCWAFVDPLVTEFGLKTETCAKYYFHEGTRTGFDFRFIPCAFF